MLRNPLWTIVAIFLAFGTVVAAEQDTTEWKPNSGEDLEITIPRFSASPKIDGALDEDVWNKAKRIGNFVEFQPGDNTKPTVQTDVLLGYDSENIYIGFVCYENDCKQIRATLTNRDEIGNDDMAIVLIDTYGDLKRGYIFIVTPYGVQADGYQGTSNSDMTFDTNWKSTAKILDDRWTAEIAIPFKSIRFPEKEAQDWRVHFARRRPRDSEYMYSWAPINRDIPTIWTQAGHLWINERITGSKRQMEFLPEIIGAQSGYLADDDDPNTFQNDWSWPSIGLSAKYGLTSNLTLDLALNPDYSQIESDVVQIDVNTRFALYYPEKRPFFIEGSDFFDTEIRAVYTRTINDPLLAARLTGKVGKTAIGYVIARDDHTPWVIPFEETSGEVSSNKKSLSNILRIKHDVLEDSYLGALFTDRELPESFNRVTGFDGSLRFLNNYFFSFQALGSWTKEPDDDTLSQDFNGFTFGRHTSDFDGESFTGTAYELGFSRSARHWNFSLWHEDYSPTFRADNGFIRTNDFREYGGWTGLHLWPNKWLIEETQPQMSAGVVYNYDGELRSRWLNPSIWMRLKNQTNFNMWSNFSSSRYADTTFSGIWNVGGSLQNTYSDLVMGEVWFNTGKEIIYDIEPPILGYTQEIGFWSQIKPTKKLRMSFVYDREWLWEKKGGAEVYDVYILRNTTTYQFSKHLSFRLVTQYYSGNFQIDPLISYELNPFTVFYFGSNHNAYDFGKPYGIRETDRQIFLKLRYQFRTTFEDIFGKVAGVWKR